jgi:flagellar hook-length control protein FliK
MTPVLAPVPVAASPSTAGSSPSSSTASAVLDQVLPAVPRVVLRGDGTSRLTLKLHPADLGEVHLTVTVRGNEVDVTMSAGPQAREALTDGSARLRGLLEGIGHTTGQVVVRDLPSGPAASATPASQQPGASTTQTGGQTSGQPHGQADVRDQAFRRPTVLDGDLSARGERAGDPSLNLRTGAARHQPSGPAGLDVTI